MYSGYQKLVKNVLKTDDFNFKSDRTYNSILEHVSHDQGKQYLYFIKSFINMYFKEITFEHIHDYVLMNDTYGNPNKQTFMYDTTEFSCSPTSLRYVLHSLLILKHFEETQNKKFVEIGCGYGGLFLAMNHFSTILNIEIDHYYFIDLPEICDLIKIYLDLNKSNVHIPYSLHSGYHFGVDINDSELFLISNYCFTEIDEFHRSTYIKRLFPKVTNGFITWQTCFNVPIESTHIIGKDVKKVTEEYPQTSPHAQKNYYVYF
jgi:hypothetical protein